MNRFILFTTFIGGLSVATAAWAYVAGSANVSKANGYAIVTPPASNLLVSKANGYAIIAPPASNLLVSKANAYVIVSPPAGNLLVSKAVAYAIVVRNYPSVRIIQ